MHARAVPVLLLAMLAATAACGDGAKEEEQGSAGFVLEGEEPYVSPEDSAEAAEAVQARGDALRDSLRRASGEKGGAGAAAPASAGAPEARYQACMAQAGQAEGPVRERLLQACENIRAQPPAESPAP